MRGKIFVNNFREFCLVWLLAKKGMLAIMFTQSQSWKYLVTARRLGKVGKFETGLFD